MAHQVSPSGSWYLSVSCRLFPRDKEIERKKPWTAGTVYIKRVLERSCGDTRVSDALASAFSPVTWAQQHTICARSKSGNEGYVRYCTKAFRLVPGT